MERNGRADLGRLRSVIREMVNTP